MRIGELQCWSCEPPVPDVSGSKGGLNLVVSRGFLHWYPNDCSFLPDWFPRI